MVGRTHRVAGILLALAVLAGCGRSPAPTRSDVPPAADASAATPTPSPSPSPADPGTAEGLLLAKPWTGDLDGLLERRYIRVLVIPDKMNFFFDGTQIKGVTYDAMREFEAFLNKKFNRTTSPVGFIFVPVQRDEILQALVAGRGDIAAAGLAVSPARDAIVDFSDPVRDRIKVIPVGGPGAPPLTSVDDLAGKTVYVPRA